MTTGVVCKPIPEAQIQYRYISSTSRCCTGTEYTIADYNTYFAGSGNCRSCWCKVSSTRGTCKNRPSNWAQAVYHQLLGEESFALVLKKTSPRQASEHHFWRSGNHILVPKRPLSSAKYLRQNPHVRKFDAETRAQVGLALPSREKAHASNR